jgi:hypothetical protein
MQWERKAILSLVALGRITPQEAERLLAVWNSGREELWVVGACVAACAAQFLPEMARVAQLFRGIHHAVSAVTFWMGGVL